MPTEARAYRLRLVHCTTRRPVSAPPDTLRLDALLSLSTQALPTFSTT